MSRIKPVSYKRLVKVFEAEGWEFVKQAGSHLQFKKAGAKRRVVIPRYKDIPVFIIENNLRTAGINRERYFELLKETK